jgi:hypothetical protein
LSGVVDRRECPQEAVSLFTIKLVRVLANANHRRKFCELLPRPV